MKKIFSVVVLSLVALTCHATIISCPKSAAELSSLFEGGWEYQADRDFYFSYLSLVEGAQVFKGALHTDSSTLPQDKNPHLSFAKLRLSDVPHYSIWQIDCQYQIGNTAMTDMDDGFLHLTTDVSTEKTCKQLNATTVNCA